ncbi:hypothetical protein S245_063211, partial [Arachis hypogaea]
MHRLVWLRGENLMEEFVTSFNKVTQNFDMLKMCPCQSRFHMKRQPLIIIAEVEAELVTQTSVYHWSIE